MKAAYFLIAFTVLALVSASNLDPVQDFCVAVNEVKDGRLMYGIYILLNYYSLLSTILVSGKFCKDPKLAIANDFSFSGLNVPKDVTNALGSNVTAVNVVQIPGLNTLGISMVRINYAPYGTNPPHTHPRATEILFVQEGTLYVGFVTSNPENRLISKVLYPGDAFVFPVGLIHFQFNVGTSNAVAFASLSSQNPGVITIAKAVFGSKPAINSDVLTKAFQVDKDVVNYLQKQFWTDNN